MVFDRLDISLTNNHLVLPFSQWPKLNVLCVLYTLILVSGMSKLFLMLAHFVHIELLTTRKPPFTHIYTWLKKKTKKNFCIVGETSMDAWFWYRHTHKHTRAFKVQNLRSAKRFNQSRLDFLPELGYVYICYSILKPSNYVLSCTPSHMLTKRLTCVTAPEATSTPHSIWTDYSHRHKILHPLLTAYASALQTILLSALSDCRVALF